MFFFLLIFAVFKIDCMKKYRSTDLLLDSFIALIFIALIAFFVSCFTSCTTASMSKRGVIYTNAYDTIIYQSTYVKSIKK